MNILLLIALILCVCSMIWPNRFLLPVSLLLTIISLLVGAPVLRL